MLCVGRNIVQGVGINKCVEAITMINLRPRMPCVGIAASNAELGKTDSALD